MAAITPTVKLNNGKEMPVLGLGTWMLDKTNGKNIIKEAIDAGYRHFDTALIYHSEAAIGEAIKEKIADGTIKREDVFITSKLWCSYAHPGMVTKACKLTLKNLGLDYLDLYLIHWPFVFKPVSNPDEMVKAEFRDVMSLLTNKEYFPRDDKGNIILTDNDYVDTWKEMEECVRQGLVKSIGISNFNAEQMDRLLEKATIKPVTNQFEIHPYLNQKKLIQFCKDRDIIPTAYGPLGSSSTLVKSDKPSLMENPVIVKIAKEKNKTPAQVILRYLIQLGTIVIPKTDNPKRLVENISVFDFTLSSEEMGEIDTLNCHLRMYIIPEIKNHKYYPFKNEF